MSTDPFAHPPIDHDQLSKSISKTFFKELLELFTHQQQRGEKLGVARTMLRIYEERWGVVPESVRGALLTIGDAGRLDALLPVFVNGSADDIARALLS